MDFIRTSECQQGAFGGGMAVSGASRGGGRPLGSSNFFDLIFYAMAIQI